MGADQRRELRPREIVAELDKYIVGQRAAKRSVAVAVRNRYRRQLLPGGTQEEIYPKNILMIGPTGVGKTEIARRLARLVNAPFVKVEATKFTEVGYVGRDVESMVRDLVETSLRMIRAERMEAVADEARRQAERRLLDALAPLPGRNQHKRTPLEALLGSLGGETGAETEDSAEAEAQAESDRSEVSRKLAAGELETERIGIEVEDQAPPLMEMFTGTGMEELGVNMGDVLGQMMPRRRKRREVTVAEARRIFTAEEANRLVDAEQSSAEAIAWAEQSGIIFLDEIDKVAGVRGGTGPDVSREGVQRDILPIVEGSTVMTRYGQVKTDHILFIAAGAFHMSKPSDLIPELQGRFPIRVELDSLERDDLRRILTEPENALVRQYQQLLGTEGIRLEFTDRAIDELADLCVTANDRAENIGARRLHTLLERVLDELSFEAPDLGQQTITITDDYVRDRLVDVIADGDLTRYIL